MISFPYFAKDWQTHIPERLDKLWVVLERYILSRNDLITPEKIKYKCVYRANYPIQQEPVYFNPITSNHFCIDHRCPVETTLFVENDSESRF